MAKHREALNSDNETITVTDFGAGSRVFSSNSRKVSAIAKHAGIGKKRQHLLYKLVRYLKPATILELGTSLGLSTMAMALGNPEAVVKTLEGCSNTAHKASSYFNAFKIHNVELKVSNFDAYLAENEVSCDLIYMDGNHNGEKTLEYFDILKKQANNNTLIILDDIYWSPEMTAAWKKIISDEQVSVSIDTFQWGLVFFRKEQHKQHFKIRL
jgi:predicted O-methyltransferase YrrM